MLRYLLRLIGLFTTVEPPAGDLGGEVPPVEAPPSAPAGGDTPAGDPSLEDMNAAARARALGDAPVDEIAPDDMPYRDAKALRDDIAQAREAYGPWVSGLPATHVAAYAATAPAEGLVLANPEIAGDLAVLRAAWPQFDAQEQEIVRAIAAGAASDPQGTMESIAQAAAIIRGDDPDDGDDGAADVDSLGFSLDDPDRPLTARDLEAQLDQREQQRQYEASAEQQRQTVLTELNDLGYDPTSSDPAVSGLADAVLSIAQRLPDRSIAKAHEIMQMMAQRNIDDYASGKLTDASRPQPTPGGAPPAAEGASLDTLDAMNQAARERAAAVASREG